MNVSLDVPVGEWRYISDEEMNELNQLVSDSLKTNDAEF